MTSEFTIAVHALTYLNHKKKILNSDELAQNVCTNPARIRKVMAKLKKAGLVETREGAEGGYLFTGEPRKICLRSIAEAVEARFVGMSWRSGDPEMECLVASGMADIMDDILGGLNSQCLEQLEQITIDDIDRRIFRQGEENIG